MKLFSVTPLLGACIALALAAGAAAETPKAKARTADAPTRRNWMPRRPTCNAPPSASPNCRPSSASKARPACMCSNAAW